MGETNAEKGGEIRLSLVLEVIQTGNQKQRIEGLKNLKSIFDRITKATNVGNLSDKAFHKIYEIVFQVALTEKQIFLGAKKNTKATALNRLSTCADAIRTVITAGAQRLEGRTVEAVIDHITQALPKADGEYCEPLAQHYLKALSVVVDHKANVERLKIGTWVEVVDFCLQGIKRYLDDSNGEPSGLSRSFLLLGSSHLSGSGAKSSSGNGHSPQIQAGSVSRQNAEDLLQTLLSLVSATNAPLVQRYDEVANTMIHFLRSQSSTISQAHQISFSIINAVLLFTSADRTSFSQSLAKDVIPIISRFFQGKTVAKDEMLNSVRDEMWILLFKVQLHLEHIIVGREAGDLPSKLEDLSSVLIADYARRLDRDQLQLDDLDMEDLGSATVDVSPFRLHVFRLRPHNFRAERNWANLQAIAILDRLMSLGDRVGKAAADKDDNDDDKHPRKRQRIAKNSDRLLDPLRSEDEKTRLAGLQILPFILQDRQLPASTLSLLLGQLSICCSDKRRNIASWALVAIASCTYQNAVVETGLVDWMHLWHAGTRALIFSPTCRAAALQLHSILAKKLLQYHEVGEDVNAIITAADISGPVVLCDTAIFLMMHILHARVTEVPGASMIACNHVIRWLFARWNPGRESSSPGEEETESGIAERSFAVHCDIHVKPHFITDLLRTSLGLPRMMFRQTTMPWGPIAQSWQQHLDNQDVLQYLLLLDDPYPATKLSPCISCPKYAEPDDKLCVLDTAHFHSARRLILELLLPKCSEVLESWKSQGADRSSFVSPETFRNAINTSITVLLMMPHFADTSLPQFVVLESDLASLTRELLNSLNDSGIRNSDGTHILVETLLQSVHTYLPACASAEYTLLSKNSPHLPQFFIKVAEELSRHCLAHAKLPAGTGEDLMEIDDDFPTQQSQARTEGQRAFIPRHNLALDMGSASFYLVATGRLMLFAAMRDGPELTGLVSSAFVDQLLSMTHEELLSCRRLLQEMLQSDLVLDIKDATRLVFHVGGILSSIEYDRCEIALCLCLDILVGMGSIWLTTDDGTLAEFAAELYQWFINVALHKDIASPEVQKGIARLLLLLLRIEPEYGLALSMPSPRSSLFEILQKSNVTVKFYIGKQLPDIFELFVLKAHDDVFVDVLGNLPSDPDCIEGIAFRMFVLSRLASKWPTLLRRCIYHIFETPGRIPDSLGHATRCLMDVSSALDVGGARELFSLFSAQLLYTWLEGEDIEDIPYQIFGFSSLRDLVADAQEEATGLMIMRSQDEEARRLAEILGVTESQLLQNCFTKVIAYSIAHDISVPRTVGAEKYVTGESRVKKCLGADLFFDCINLHFADIVALLFNIIDQEDNVEKYLAKDEKLLYAATIMRDIKSMASSDVTLPPNQQPTFKAKYLCPEIEHLCGRTVYEVSDLYTPALVTSIGRKLLDSIHPALGSLHACSILRKLRILISLAGESAIQGYPLHMLLQSVRPFTTDPECADDAIGITQYLLSRGSTYLMQSPTFVAGIALSIFGSLRTFLQSSQSKTTQESQHRVTMSKAQKFHTWMGKYVSEYDSPALKGESKSNFRALVESAYLIRSVGNAENGTPESVLLLRLLQDEQSGGNLLSRPSRELALAMLCSKFQCPPSYRTDILGSDETAVANAAVVWKSCRNESVSKEYLSWSARVLGRAFAASGHIHQELLQESSLTQIKELSTSFEGPEGGSKACVLSLIQGLTLTHDRRTVGLAEAALRLIVSTSDESLTETCQKSLSGSLYTASIWAPYQVPPSETSHLGDRDSAINDSFTADAVLRPHWLRDLAIVLAQSVPDDPVLCALEPILRGVTGFAERLFAFILHLFLSIPTQGQPLAKKQLSTALVTWFRKRENIDKESLKLLINSILYLRTQPLPQEKSCADRSNWLDIDYIEAAAAATHCGMFKTALLFAEESCSGLAKSSRRTSSTKESFDKPEFPNHLLLAIFQNIDDPDLYYGVQQDASLSTILARLEYEKDGPKSLAFRGAQYDSHLRRQDPKSALDAQSLVKALDVLSLSGLSHSLLQAQQTVGMSTASLESMFHTARKLEQWDIPAPRNSGNNAVTIYKAFQAFHTAADQASILQAINEGFDSTMASLVREDLSANALHGSLQTLAALVEMDEVVNTQGSEQFEEILSRFQSRSDWMNTGRFDDIGRILSCRGTTISTLSQQPRLHKLVNISSVDTRLIEVQTALLASTLNRAHSALQESLSLATSLMDLIKPCRELNLNVEVAIHMEAANALWDQGEMASSIGMLLALDLGPSLKKQTIPVGRSNLLSKIGHQVSVARLEKPDRIIEKYLKPALKDLRGRNNGSEAGEVFHQFAVFCDQQLQDPDSSEDLERLKKLSKMKAEEVDDLSKMLKNATSPAERSKYKGYHQKAKQWLALDEQELQRHCSSRDEFLRQSLENYLLALSASDDHDNNALRFTALWLEHSDEQIANEAVSMYLSQVPSRKFATLMNQLTSRLLDNSSMFQELLLSLVLRICTDHPYHGMYQIYAGASSRANMKDDVAVSRLRVTTKVAKMLVSTDKAGQIWQSVNISNKVYCQLAGEKDDQKYKAGRRIPLKDSQAGSRLNSVLAKYPIPPPTMQIELATDLDYSKLPVMVKFESQMTIASGVSAPKIITAVASDGARFKQLVKGGNDDLRQDAIMEQVFAQVSELLKANRSSRQRNLSIRTYKVLPLTSIAGVIEFVPNTIPLHEYLMPAHERFYPKDLKGSQCRKEIGDVQTQPLEARIKKFRSVTERFHPVMRYFFIEKFDDPDEWFVKRLAYTRSTAAISILGHVLGLGDRHGHNILLDAKSGEVVHIDLGVAFEMGRVLPVPELVPFRLTRDIVDGMGLTKTEGVFRRCCEFTLEALRKEVYSIMTILDVLRYDPLYSWSISPVRLAKLQEGQSAALEPAQRVPGDTTTVNEKTKDVVNEPGEAARALTIVNKKLSKTLSVTATVNDLINQASDEKNLAVLYSGWAAYA